MAGIKMLPGETESEYWERLGKIIDGLDDLVRRNGRVIARLPAGTLGSKELIKSLTGILNCSYDLDEVKTEVLRGKIWSCWLMITFCLMYYRIGSLITNIHLTFGNYAVKDSAKDISLF